jgi:hypothetical protein
MQTWNSVNTKIESQRKLYCFERDRHASVAYLCPSLFVSIKNLDSPRYPREIRRLLEMHHCHGYKHETVNKTNTVQLQYEAHGPRGSSIEHGVVFVCAKGRKFDWSGESFLRACCGSRNRAPGAHSRDQLAEQQLMSTHATNSPDSNCP